MADDAFLDLLAEQLLERLRVRGQGALRQNREAALLELSGYARFIPGS